MSSPDDRIILTRSNLQALIDEIKAEISVPAIDRMYPIGYVYITSKAPSDGGDPNILFPGTYWKRLKNCFIRAAEDGDAVDDTLRGKDTLTTNDLPYHKHKSGGYTGTVSASGNGGGYSGTFTCSKNASGSWSNGGIVVSRSQTSSGSYGGSGTAYQTSEYTLNIQHVHSTPDTAGNYKANGSTVQPSSVTSVSIRNQHLSRYVWQRITQSEYNQLQGV